ncbi:hypothetical protein B7R56_11020 [Pseudomonas savastanoi pv. retacarpa]|uniref:Secreted protein n=1 Tax=Pseudomonas savastanoi pv. nerii TaxID=360921 RepID=A0AB73Q3B7_PSESS|nr:hypothetical protein B7R56_11020 [Pseudomonas savastanoi pv. retacarpa]PAB29129.1 hypothetical protein CC205_20230 [Pseudomonas savastanoi pv. nerii]PAB36455.1 hypothetical protein CC202_04120 [Pseudomonas savastanoi]PAB38167.1 hypothetical protein CCZ00_02435 [Pseudomonas savastanoi pv. fraxini]
MFRIGHRASRTALPRWSVVTIVSVALTPTLPHLNSTASGTPALPAPAVPIALSGAGACAVGRVAGAP